MNPDVARIGRQLDAIPASRFHLRLMGLIVGGVFVDQFDLLLAGGVLGALVKEGWSNLSTNANFISATFAGLTIGAMGAGWMGDRFGRRFSYQTNLAIFGLFSFAAACAPSMGWLIVFRFLMGIGLGAELVVAYSTLGEFVPAKVRGRWVAAMAIISNSSIFFSAVCGYFIIPRFGWRWMFVLVGVAALIVWFLRKSMPESPRWLASRGRVAEANQIVSRIAAAAGVPVPEAGADHAIVSQPEWVPIRVLFGQAVWRRTVLGMILPSVAFVVNYGYASWLTTFFVKEGLSVTSSIGYTIVTNIGGFVGAGCAFYLGDKIGRKKTIIGACIWSGIFGLIYSQGHSLWWINIFGLLMLTGNYCFSTASIAMYLPELFSTEYRLRGVGLASMVARIAVIVTPYPILWAFQQGGLVAVTSILSGAFLIAIIAILLLGVETKQKSLEVTAPSPADENNSAHTVLET